MDSRAVNPGGMVAIAGAIPMEVAGLRRRGSFSKADINGTEYLRGGVRGTDAALLLSGIGEERAYLTAGAVCGGLPLRAIISIGLSGSLSPGLRPGDVVIADRVKTLASRGFGEYRCDPGLVTLASRAFLPADRPSVGPLLAVDRVILSHEEKVSVARSHECLAIDMESAGVARAAKKAGVPYLAIRAISDGFDDDMPVDFNRFTKNGAMDWPRFLLHIVTHPATIGPLVRLGKNSRMAAANLTLVVERVLEKMGQSAETGP